MKSKFLLPITSVLSFALTDVCVLAQAEQNAWKAIERKIPEIGLLMTSFAAGDTTTINLQIQAGTLLDSSQAIGSCLSATGYNDVIIFPSFISYQTTEVRVNGFGGVRAFYNVFVSSSAPPGLAQGEATYTIYRAGTECGVMTLHFEIEITPPQIPIADFFAGRTTIVEGGLVQFFDQSKNAITDRLWDFGDGGTSSEINPTHTYPLPGSYTVSLTATGAAGTDTETKVNYITVVPQGTPGQQIWAFETNGEIISPPAIDDDGTVYATSLDNNLYAINPNGSLKWKHSAPGRMFQAPVIGTDTTIYATTGSLVFAVDANGNRKWTFAARDFVRGPALAVDGTIYVASNDKNLYAVNPDGTERWHFEIGSEGTIPSIGNDGTIYVVGSLTGSRLDKKLYALTPSGETLWTFGNNDFTSSVAIGGDGTLYVGTTLQVFALNANGTEKWKSRLGLGFYAQPAIGFDGTLYLGTDNNSVLAFDANGAEKWTFRIRNGNFSSPAIGSDGTIYVPANNDTLYAITENGALKWAFPFGVRIGLNYLEGSAPAIDANGTVYVGYQDKKLYAISSNSGGLADTPWPKAGQNNRNTRRVLRPAPYLISPANGATGVSLTPSLTWSSIAGATAYELQVDTREDFSSTFLFQANLSETMITLDSLLEGQGYYWHVRATTTEGTSSWSVTRRFTTLFLPPVAPQLIAPENGATGIALNARLEWTPSNANATYHLQLSSKPDFTALFVDSSAIDSTGLEISGLQSLTAYYWRVRAENPRGVSEWSSTFNFTTTTSSTVDQINSPLPARFALRQNYPNPFDPGTTIQYESPRFSHVKIEVFNLQGQLIVSLVNALRPPGIHLIRWNGKDAQGESIASGIYIYRLASGDISLVRKLVLTKRKR